MSFIRNSLITFMGTIGRVLFAMVSQIFISRVLGPVGKGLYNFLVQIPSVLVPFSSLGLSYANTYYVAKDPKTSRKAVGTSAVAAALLGALMALALAISYVLLKDGYMKDVTLPQLVLIILSIPVSLVNLYWLGVLWGKDQIGRYNIALLLQNAALAAGAALFAFLKILSVTAALAVWVGSNLFTTFYMLPDMLRISEGRLFKLDLGYLRRATSYSLKSYIYNVMNVVNNRLGLFIVTGYTTFEQVGLYGTAVTLAEMLNYVGNSVNTALIPKLASGNDQVTFKQTPKIARITIFITFLAGLGLAALGYPLIILFFGRSFAGSYIPLLLMIPGIIALAGSTVLSGDLMARGKPSYTSTSSAIGMVLTVVLNFILVPVWGIAGAAVSSTAVYTGIFAINYFFYRKESGEPLKKVLILTKSDFETIITLVRNFKGKGRRKS